MLSHESAAITPIANPTTGSLIADLAQRVNDKGLSDFVAKSYINWILRFCRFNNTNNPVLLNSDHAKAFISHLANTLNHDIYTQKSAINALRFLFKEFLKVDLGNLHLSRRSTRRGFFSRFGQHHCEAVINKMNGTTQLMAKLALLSNVRLKDIINLRLADIDLKKARMVIRDPKGKIRLAATIPIQLLLDIRIQMLKVHRLVQLEKEERLMTNGHQQFDELAVLNQQLEPEWQYLFLAGNLKSNQSQAKRLAKVPISLLKNDIRLAIKRYQRFLPEGSGQQQENRKVKAFKRVKIINCHTAIDSTKSLANSGLQQQSLKFERSEPQTLAKL